MVSPLVEYGLTITGKALFNAILIYFARYHANFTFISPVYNALPISYRQLSFNNPFRILGGSDKAGCSDKRGRFFIRRGIWADVSILFFTSGIPEDFFVGVVIIPD